MFQVHISIAITETHSSNRDEINLITNWDHPYQYDRKQFDSEIDTGYV